MALVPFVVFCGLLKGVGVWVISWDMTLPETMRAVVTMGHGGLEQLVVHDEWVRPEANAGEVLIEVRACGLNNTDINTRLGWYSKSVTEATTPSSKESGQSTGTPDGQGGVGDSTWGGKPLGFPRIQGADACGTIVAVGEGVSSARIGERVITDNWLRDPDDPMNRDKAGYFGSECNGGFAEYTVIASQNALAVKSDLSDAELATFSCSYSTAEGMLSRAKVDETDTVLIPGASGGVGSALVQLAKLRKARVIAMAGASKQEQVAALGADKVIERTPSDLQNVLAGESVSVVADVVGGNGWHERIDLLTRGGRYVCSGAIAGPMVQLDLRTFYLRDLNFIGSTVIDGDVMPRVVSYIEAKAIKPALAATYPLEELQAAQAAFIAKKHVGNIVVCP